ncbi:hypothetical protein [Actinoplanes sp. GCM10030250]|uniref:hypothetical protein n=1 Tax=Actinoplanes sp. GCM10030250 TaxID=3273376 RepID=UPI003623A034
MTDQAIGLLHGSVRRNTVNRRLATRRFGSRRSALLRIVPRCPSRRRQATA